MPCQLHSPNDFVLLLWAEPSMQLLHRNASLPYDAVLLQQLLQAADFGHPWHEAQHIATCSCLGCQRFQHCICCCALQLTPLLQHCRVQQGRQRV